MEKMAKDVQPFLFDATDIKKVIHFPDYIKQVKLNWEIPAEKARQPTPILW